MVRSSPFLDDLLSLAELGASAWPRGQPRHLGGCPCQRAHGPPPRARPARAVLARRRRSSPLLRRPPHAGPGAGLNHYDKADDGVALALPELSLCAADGLALFFDDLLTLAQARGAGTL
jgi:hypothetical protein